MFGLQLPYYLVRAGAKRWEEAVLTLCDLRFIEGEAWCVGGALLFRR